MLKSPNKNDPSAPLQEALKGRYLLERELGRGAMGIVYLAEEIALDRMVALKLLPPHLAADPRRRERFLNEARTAARLSHPGIVPIFAVDQVDGFVFFTMDYIEGQTLAGRVRAHGPLALDEATRVLRDVAWAVAYAHVHGVIHRDLKAENIMLERKSGRALVMDFGIAQVQSEPDFIDAGKIVGTVQYMSPEHASGRPVDERSDVYALGVVGYFASSGSLPFQGANVPEILDQQINRPAPPLVIGEGSGQSALAHAVSVCLAKDPEQRFQTAADLAESLTGRGELPVPLRVFVSQLRHSLFSSSAFGALGALTLLQLVNALALGHWGAAGVAGGVIALLLSVTALFLLSITRRVLQSGYLRADIVLALSDDLDRHREEQEFRFGRHAGAAERVARAATFAGLGLFGFGAALGLMETIGLGLALSSMTVGAGAVIIAGLVSARRHERRRDPAAQRWLAFWKSRFGAWTARLAGVNLKRLQTRGARATESAIVLAADRLYENLPEAAKRWLVDLPDTLRRLELQTADTRAFIADLETSLPSDGVAREVAQQRLTDSITVLETIRLAVDRLEDGAGTVQGVTAELDAAREIHEAVDRMLAGWREVEEAMSGG